MPGTTLRRRRARGAELYAKADPSQKRLPRPSTEVVFPQQVDNDPTWTAAKVRSALEEHEDGQFFESAKLIEAMGRDDRIYGCLRTRRSGLLSRSGADFSIEPGKSGADTYVDEVCDWWGRAVPTPVIGRLLDDLVMAGVAIARVPYKTNTKTWTPGLVRNWPLQSVWYDHTKRLYMISTNEHGSTEIQPDDPNWLVIQCVPDRPWMCGAVRALGLLFAMRQPNWTDWAKYNERHGSPIIRVYEPPTQDEADKETFFTSVRRMGSRGAIRLPQPDHKDSRGYDVDLLEATANTFETFKAFRSDVDASIAIALLGQNLSTEVKGGSLAAAKAHMEIRQDVVDDDAEIMSSELGAQVVVPWGYLNHAGFDPEDAPQPHWDTSEEEDQVQKGEAWNKTADAAQKFRALGYPIDEDRMLEEAGVPVIEGAKFPDPPDPDAEPEPEPAPPEKDDGKDGDKRPKARATVASGITARSDGFIDGQEYADKLADNGREEMADHLREGLAFAMSLALEADTFEGMEQAVLAAYAGAKPPHSVAAAMAKLYTMAHRAGEVAVDQDA